MAVDRLFLQLGVATQCRRPALSLDPFNRSGRPQKWSGEKKSVEAATLF